VSTSNALQYWREGERRLLAGAPERRRALDRVVDAVYAELRRRLGGAFTSGELIALYEGGISWCLQVAVDTEPDRPWAWDAWIADAAFQRYLREARDYAGGRLLL
jgi:hypothetical protein